MMISPKTFVDEYRNYSIEEIIEVRNDLINEIKDLEKIVFSKDRNNEAWGICPGPDVQYQVNLEYLSQICILLSEKYNEEYES